MVQSLNPSALWTLSTAVLRRPSLMIPDYQVATIADIDWTVLRGAAQQHQAVVFDKDNTLTAPYAMEIHATVRQSVQQARHVFGPQNVAVLSNSAGTATDDPDSADATAFEQANIDLFDGDILPVIRHEAKKPSRKCWQQVLDHFKATHDDDDEKATPITQASQVIMVGDRLWTDVVFGNLYGCTTIFCATTLDDRTDNWTARRIRPLEQRVTRMWQWILRRQPKTMQSSVSNEAEKEKDV